MHPQDKMIPKERMGAYLSGKPVDRVPILPFITAVSGKAAGMTHIDAFMAAGRKYGVFPLDPENFK